MHLIKIALIALLAATPLSAHAAQDRFTYVGNMLQPEAGNGIQGVTFLQFTLTGRRPPKGQCEKHLTLQGLYDGMYSPKILAAHGYVQSPESKIVVCSDPVTGKLTEKLYVEMDMYYEGVLVASYSWNSHDPKHDKSADFIESFENVEYHTSVAKRAGHFAGHRLPGQ